GMPLNVGRKQRVVSPPMKRALRGRDKCCRFPGCDRHHRLFHEGGFSIQANHNDEWYFRNAAGKILQ
ncbi:MAG: hypothetical protein NWQ11_08975, partial [Pseudomonadales bacterium]|nr:hypothetical protein [Pseudomonadales bacterium]